MRYEKCDKCEHKVPQVLERMVKGKRLTLCFSCAKKEGWFDAEQEQSRLF